MSPRKKRGRVPIEVQLSVEPTEADDEAFQIKWGHCPVCGADTPKADIYRGSGSSKEVESRDTYCAGCLAAKVTEAIEDGECYCSAGPPPHRHLVTT